MPSSIVNCYASLNKALAVFTGFPQQVRTSVTHCLKDTFIRMHDILGTEASIEIGAHAAEYSIALKQTYGDKIKVSALEASPVTHKKFSSEIDFKNIGIDYQNTLVSDIDGEVIFYEYFFENQSQTTAATISSLYARNPDMLAIESIKQPIAIQSIKGDSFIQTNYPGQKNISLWIDVEGAQHEVLTSFRKAFALKQISSVYIEVESKKLWPEQKMFDHEVIYFMHEAGFMPFLRDNEFGIQYNIMFIRKDLLSPAFSVFHKHYLKRIADIITKLK